jgi:Ca-activated chloride channel family protein
VFVNDLEDPVEATYMFPTDPDQHTVVSKLLIEMDDKIVEGKVFEKEKAKEKYEDALAGGHAAVMVQEHEKEPDLLKMNIGGIHPGKEVRVRIQLIKQLEIEAGSYCLRIPTSYVIRYTNPAQVNVGVSVTELEKPKNAEYSFRVEINTAKPLTRISIPSHSKVTKVKKDIA